MLRNVRFITGISLTVAGLSLPLTQLKTVLSAAQLYFVANVGWSSKLVMGQSENYAGVIGHKITAGNALKIHPDRKFTDCSELDSSGELQVVSEKPDTMLGFFR
jgi:hypothetical protein